MNTQAPPLLPETSAVPPLLADAAPARAIAPARWLRAVMFVVKYAIGVLLLQSLLGAVLVVGWVQRLGQRAALKAWWSWSERRWNGQSFLSFLAEHADLREHLRWPNWLVAQEFHGGAGVWERAGALTRSLRRNFWLGLQGVFNTAVCVGPALLCWWFGWYDGWNNSFNKGYEQYAVGMIISWIGIALFIAAMFYVPLAQARQAVTGRWRTFYDFRLVWTLVRQRWLSSAGLALLYALFAIPLNVMKTAPAFWSQSFPESKVLTPAEITGALGYYYLWCGVLVLPLFILLRVLAAKIYAAGILHGVRQGRIVPARLAENERLALERLDLAHARPRPQSHLLLRAAAWAATRAGRVVSGFALVALWFAFVAQNFIVEFLNYHTALGFVNQPLVLAPWFKYVPASLSNPAGEFAGLALVVLLALLARSIVQVVVGWRMARIGRSEK
jgi:hypothetical protein